MASIDSLKASDGSGNASVATVQTTRSGGATTIEVDTVQGINTNFHATMGTPHTFQDPVTGEDITIISEATAVDFKGHVDGANLEIDTIAPGYTDNGSEVGDIVIIKPTTQWGDEAAEVLEVAHDDDGTLKEDASVAGGNQSLDTLFDGWIKTNETWTYSDWTAGTRIAEITVPTDATTKYQAGMRVKFTQPTDGIKYGIIHKVEATTLHVFLPDGTDFDNEAITTPFFSLQKTPFGFDTNPTLWQVNTPLTNTRSTSNVSLTSFVDTLVVGVGSWKVSLLAPVKYTVSSNSVSRRGLITLSTDASTITNDQLQILAGLDGLSSGQGVFQNSFCEDYVNHTAETTYTLMGQVNSGSGEMQLSIGAMGSLEGMIKAVSTYL